MPKIFKVGGCVRDKFLGIDSHDIDFTFVLDNLNQSVGEGFEEMDIWLRREGFTIFLSTPACFTIRARFPKGSKHEKLTADFVMARKEIGYIEGTRRPNLVLGTLEDDLERRDFTVNAMAEDEDGNIIDLFNGQEDLKNKLLRTPLDANITFMDDPLRILRCLRFSITKGFKIDVTAWNAMSNPEILEKLITVVSAERIRDEIFKMMKHDTIQSLRLLQVVDRAIPFHNRKSFLDMIFGVEPDQFAYKNKMWLKPTFEQ